MHRRRSSKDEDDGNVFVFPAPHTPQSPTSAATMPLHGGSLNGVPAGEGSSLFPSTARPRVTSTPAIAVSPSFPGPPSSAGPYRTTFNAQSRPPPLNGVSYGRANGRHQPPAMRQSLSLPSPNLQAHSRTRSISGPFSPITPSPLSSSFPPQQLAMPPPHKISSSLTAPDLHPPTSPVENGSALKGAPSRRHSRIHSRNLSIFFPRPGSLPATSIAEDGTQELDFGTPPPSQDGVPIPLASPGPGQRTFREGFRFGGRPPASASAGQSSHPISPGPPQPASAGPSRRGHHHKHSLSHSFFSFLEPGAETRPEELHTQPTPVPLSPWAPISPFPSQQSVYSLDDAASSVAVAGNGHPPQSKSRRRAKSPIGRIRAPQEISPVTIGVGLWQFVVGAWLWITGQQVGSLACTGLGYWVVFDAFGVALGHVLPNYLAHPDVQGETRRPYGCVSCFFAVQNADVERQGVCRNARVETVMMFAQSVYLIFTSVYVCKETVEHLLLSSGEGHHHHHGDEVSSVFGCVFACLVSMP